MSRIFDGNFTVPVANGPRQFYLPFYASGDVTTRAFRQTFLQRQDSWTPPLFMGSEFIGGSPYYLVEETPTQHIGAGIVQFQREYSMIPISRTETRQISYTFRGIGSDQVYPLVTISGSTLASGVHTFTVSSNPSVSVGDRVVIKATQIQYPAGIQTSFVVRRTALTGTSGTTVVTDPVTAPNNNSLYFLTMQKVEDGREPRTNAVPAMVTFDYYIPGISPNVQNVEDIPIWEPELIIDAAGAETLTYTDTTVPTRTDYLSKVASGELIVAEHTRLTRWKGDIFEASTPYVKAE